MALSFLSPEELEKIDRGPYFIFEAHKRSTGFRFGKRCNFEEVADSDFDVAAARAAGQVFQSVTGSAEDLVNLNEPWSLASFNWLWKKHVYFQLVLQSSRCLLKLVREGHHSSVTGLIWNDCETVRRYPTDILLEACPWCQTGRVNREFFGIGRVLVARIAAQADKMGFNGFSIVPADGSAIDFYKHLEFTEVDDFDRSSPVLIIKRGKAKHLVRQARRSWHFALRAPDRM